MGLRLIQGEPVQEPLQLTQRDPLGRGVTARGPLHPTPFEASVVEPKPRPFPFQDFELGAIPVAKHKDRRRTGIELKGALYLCR